MPGNAGERKLAFLRGGNDLDFQLELLANAAKELGAVGRLAHGSWWQ